MSPRVPNSADINNYLVRYGQKHKMFTTAHYCLFSCTDFLLNADFNTHTHVSLLFRYHPIDDEDDITETSVDDGSNRVVLRSKLRQKRHTETQTTAWRVLCLDLECEIVF